MDYSTTDGCFCCTFVTHFSVYTVADVAATEASADQLAINAQQVSNTVNPDIGANAAAYIAAAAVSQKGAPVPATDAEPSGFLGLGLRLEFIIGGLVGALVVIAALAAFVIKRNQAGKRPATELQEVGEAMEDRTSFAQNPMQQNPMQQNADAHDPTGVVGGQCEGQPASVSAWREVLDPASGQAYYYNSETKESTWERPAEEDTRVSAFSSSNPMFGGVTTRISERSHF
jgi:hypothetical protein